jgi:hypothetical protein
MMNASQPEVSANLRMPPEVLPRRVAKLWVFQTARIFAFVVLVALGLMFTPSGVKAAGCAANYPAGTPVSPLKNSQPDNAPNQPTTIVGLWHVVYTATYTTNGPLPVPLVPPADPFEFSETLKTWHRDGTEWEELIAPPPAGGFCFGVWKPTASGNVKLHHIGVIFAPDGSIATIFYMDELDRVAPDGKTYSGTFDMKFYGPTDVFGAGPVLQEIKGATAATRIIVE